MAEVGKAYVDTTMRLANGTMAALGAEVGSSQSMFTTLGTNFGKLLGIGLVAGAGALIAGGAGLAKLGSTFDAEYDKIRVGTGATGEALAGLQDDFKNLLTNVPTDFASAGTAVADLNTRLGLTGDALQDSATQFINLSRITGTDLTSNIANITRTFGDWSIASGDQSAALDQLYRASQASGAGIDTLSTSVVQFGAPLRNLGFGFEESLALLAQFDKAGVNTETVFAGMKAGVGKLAKAGEDVPDTFKRIVDEISALGPGTEATGLAIELFGQRAGPDMADAIAGGKFEIDEMLAAITGGTDTINGAASDTADFAEKWLLFKNKVMVGLEPLATRVFDALGAGMDWLLPKVGPLIDTFSAWIAQFSSGEGKIGEFVTNVQIFVGGLVAWWQEKWPAISATINDVVLIIQSLWDRFGATIIATAVNAFEMVKGVISGALQIIQGIIQVFAGILTGDWSKVWEGVKNILSGALGVVKSLALGAFNALRTIVAEAMTAIKTKIEDKGGEIITWFTGLPGKIKTALGALGTTLKSAGTDLVAGFWNGIKARWDTMVGALRDLASNLPGVVKKVLKIESPSKVFMELGTHVGDGFRIGIEDTWPSIGGLAASMASEVGAAGTASLTASGGVGLASASTVHIDNVTTHDVDEFRRELDVMVRSAAYA